MNDLAETAEKSILVVDDNQDIRDFMQIALEAEGYVVHTAKEGVQALAMQRDHPADLLLTDIFMPGMEGISTIAGFKAEFPGTKVIAMSAGGGRVKRDFLSAAVLIGANATLRKPFTEAQLLETVRAALQPR